MLGFRARGFGLQGLKGRDQSRPDTMCLSAHAVSSSKLLVSNTKLLVSNTKLLVSTITLLASTMPLLFSNTTLLVGTITLLVGTLTLLVSTTTLLSRGQDPSRPDTMWLSAHAVSSPSSRSLLEVEISCFQSTQNMPSLFSGGRIRDVYYTVD